MAEQLRASIPILRFSAGSLRLAIAAEDVLEVVTMTFAEDPHIASLLGVEPGNGERRTVRLAAPDSDMAGSPSYCFQVDMPMDVVHCESERILPLPAGLSFSRWKPVMGFAEYSERIVLLLDIPSVIEVLLESYQRGLL